MKENPRYKNLYFNQEPVSVQKTPAVGITELPILKSVSDRRAKNKVARKARKVNKKRRRG